MTADQPTRGKRVQIYLAADLVKRWDALTPTTRSAVVAEALRAYWNLRKERTMKTYTYTLKMLDDLRATDLRDEARAALGDAQAARITIYDETGTVQHPQAAEALWLPGEGRLGIAWGADATWADVRDLESGIEMWLNDDEAWTAAN